MHFNLQNSTVLFLRENSRKTLLVAENHGNEKALWMHFSLFKRCLILMSPNVALGFKNDNISYLFSDFCAFTRNIISTTHYCISCICYFSVTSSVMQWNKQAINEDVLQDTISVHFSSENIKFNVFTIIIAYRAYLLEHFL